MSSYVGLGCCPCCKINTCLSGDTIDTGCCLGCDDLIMWSERPGWSISQRYFLKGNLSCSPPCNNCKGPCNGQVEGCICGQDTQQIYKCIPEVPCATELDPCPRLGCYPEANIGKIINYNVYAEELEPLQTVYRFYKTYWRPDGFYTGGYPVHQQRNTHRRALASQLPIAADPIHDGEIIDPGLYSRCKYETVEDWPKMSWWNDSYMNAIMASCLGGESPCAESSCNNYGQVECTPEEQGLFCDNFILSSDDIISDLKEGYFGLSNVKGSSNNCCYPICGDPPCTFVDNPPFCECDSYWMTRYRRRKLLDSYRTRWGVDIECYNNSIRTSTDAAVFEQPHQTNYDLTYDANMGSVILSGGNRVSPSGQPSFARFRLADHWLFNMHFERWWKIGQSTEDGLTQSFWNIPDQSGADPNPTSTQSNYPYQVDDLVPKWWIYACSGVPVFQFEIEDALLPMNTASTESPRNPAIDESAYDEFVIFRETAALYAEYSLQYMWDKMADAGYFEAKDWREEQLQAYKELDQRFPNKGYSVYANKTVEEMPLLGPYRKRYYADHVIARGLNMRKPYLRPDLVPKSALHLQPQCFIEFPGQWWSDTESLETRQQKINDYYFWAERQWVYFRGVPAGWTWASWDAELTCPCNNLCEGGQTAPNEDAAILAGCGRAKGNCIESWFNQPNISYTTNNPDNWTCKKPTGSQECTDCTDACVINCIDSCGGDQNCYDNCLSSCEENCSSCWQIINVPQCSVAEGSSSAMTGTAFTCNDPSCLNCCDQCIKIDTVSLNLIINSLYQISQSDGSFTGPAKFKFNYTFIPPETPPVFGGVGSGSTGLVLNESFAPSVGSKIFFTGMGNYGLNSNPFVDNLSELVTPTGISNFEGWTISSSGLGFFEITDTYNYFEVLLQNQAINNGALITNGSGKNPITPEPVGLARVEEPTNYYCDDDPYFIDIYAEDEVTVIRTETVDCETYQRLIKGVSSCPKSSSQLVGADPNCGCAATPIVGCPSDLCQKLSITGYCGGVHIIATQYATENKISYQSVCGGTPEPVNFKYRCLWTANTFLTPAKNLYEYNQSTKKCTAATNTSMFSYWPEVKNSHIIPQKSICNPHYRAITNDCASAQDAQYKTVPACDGGICWPWWTEVKCCGGTDQCGEPRDGDLFAVVGCINRMPCVSETHGKIWDGRYVCPPSCGTDTPSYSNYISGTYYGKDGSTGGPTESSCERDDFIGYEPSCDFKGRSVEVNS
jgi:hypothetical protein